MVIAWQSLELFYRASKGSSHLTSKRTHHERKETSRENVQDSSFLLKVTYQADSFFRRKLPEPELTSRKSYNVTHIAWQSSKFQKKN